MQSLPKKPSSFSKYNLHSFCAKKPPRCCCRVEKEAIFALGPKVPPLLPAPPPLRLGEPCQPLGSSGSRCKQDSPGKGKRASATEGKGVLLPTRKRTGCTMDRVSAAPPYISDYSSHFPKPPAGASGW
uniref:Uncharacterized protein n=1 Tax=Micrurus spixii TaxID=129469 RepID=A0A2D4N587_9SAUR